MKRRDDEILHPVKRYPGKIEEDRGAISKTLAELEKELATEGNHAGFVDMLMCCAEQDVARDLTETLKSQLKKFIKSYGKEPLGELARNKIVMELLRELSKPSGKEAAR